MLKSANMLKINILAEKLAFTIGWPNVEMTYCSFYDYGSRFFLGQGKASISHSSFRWTCWMYLQLLRVNIFSVCSGVARFRNFVVALFVDLFVQNFPWGFICQGSRHHVAQNLALGFILNQLPVWAFKQIAVLNHPITYCWLLSWVLFKHLALASFQPRRPHSPIPSRSFAAQIQTGFSSYVCSAGRFNNSFVRSATISHYCH